MNLSVTETIKTLNLCAFGKCDQCKLSWEQCDEIMSYAADLLSKLNVQLEIRRLKDIPMICTHEESKVEDYTCPVCKNVVSQRERWGNSIIFVVPKYCKFCGQRICKEEENE